MFSASPVAPYSTRPPPPIGPSTTSPVSIPTRIRDGRGLAVGLGPADDPERGADRALGIVLVRDRRPEEREDTVAGEILHRSAERLDGLDHPPDRAAEDLAGVLGVQSAR